MTVAELIVKLQALPQGHQVIMSSDAEGNRKSPLADFSEGEYLADTSYSGIVVTEEDGDEFGFTGNNAVVLSPIN